MAGDEKTAEEGPNVDEHRVFLRNLLGITEEDLRLYFGEKYGAVLKVKLMKGKRANFGFVCVENDDVVENIVMESPHAIKNQMVEAEVAFEKAEAGDDAAEAAEEEEAAPKAPTTAAEIDAAVQ